MKNLTACFPRGAYACLSLILLLPLTEVHALADLGVPTSWTITEGIVTEWPGVPFLTDGNSDSTTSEKAFLAPLANGFAEMADGATRNGALTNAVGAPDGSTTEIGAGTDFLVLTLCEELPIGTEYTIYISGRGSAATADVWEAPEGTAIPASQMNSPTGYT
ncbi:MAG: hypothetical protein AAGA62_16865, partial [Bacteroidota bacterium]